MSRRVEIVNPRGYGQSHTSEARCREYCRSGLADMLPDGRMAWRERSCSDAYVGGSFEIRIVDSFIFPHTQWVHGSPAPMSWRNR